MAGDQSKSLYDRNRAVYELLRYGVKVKPDIGENAQTVWPIDWKHPEKNHFSLAEEVTLKAGDAAAHDKRPDIVLYVNGIVPVVFSHFFRRDTLPPFTLQSRRMGQGEHPRKPRRMPAMPSRCIQGTRPAGTQAAAFFIIDLC